MMSWGIPTTVVELVPSVPSLLPFFHDDGKALLASPSGRIVVDDARRFLERSHEQFSVIVIDPPPPIEAAASSLLYSKEFYASVAKRLAPDGIMQQWIPWNADGFDEKLLVVAMTKAIGDVFPHLRAYRSLEGWGLHILASMTPIPVKTAAQMAASLPSTAAADLLEWGPNETAQAQFDQVVSQQGSLQAIIALMPDAPALTDNRPLNEYYLLRKYLRQHPN
jgi:spermidine synthase